MGLASNKFPYPKESSGNKRGSQPAIACLISAPGTERPLAFWRENMVRIPRLLCAPELLAEAETAGFLAQRVAGRDGPGLGYSADRRRALHSTTGVKFTRSIFSARWHTAKPVERDQSKRLTHAHLLYDKLRELPPASSHRISRPKPRNPKSSWNNLRRARLQPASGLGW
jgi:hypothetical protein